MVGSGKHFDDNNRNLRPKEMLGDNMAVGSNWLRRQGDAGGKDPFNEPIENAH
jgi:hypothetical protein